MDIEYASSAAARNGYKYAYLIDDREKIIFILAYKREISRLKIKRNKIENNPHNEGQVRYSSKVDEINRLINFYLQSIQLLK